MTVSVYPPGWPRTSDWTVRLEPHFFSPGFQELCAFVQTQRGKSVVYPSAEDVFNAFRLTAFSETKVVILGQDPYHGSGQAHGLSFSVEGDVRLPPSLRNIFLELADDLDVPKPTTGNLTAWASQGVFLLNTVLTVREGEPNSHRKQGWEDFTDEVITQLNGHPENLVFILWGKTAQEKIELIDDTRHVVLTSPHPSPFSARRGFFGSKPFSKANEALHRFGRDEIAW